MITFFTAERDNNLSYEDNYIDVHHFSSYEEAYEFVDISIKFNEDIDSYNMPTWGIYKVTFNNDTDYKKTELSVCYFDANWKWEHALDIIPDTALTSPWYDVSDGLDAKFYEYSREVITTQTTTHYIYNILEERNNKALEEKIGYTEFCKMTYQNYVTEEIERIKGVLELDLSDETRNYYLGYLNYLSNI